MTTDSHTELIGWLRDRARESELGAGMNEDDEELAEDMLHDAAQWRAAADALENLSEQLEALERVRSAASLYHAVSNRQFRDALGDALRDASSASSEASRENDSNPAKERR